MIGRVLCKLGLHKWHVLNLIVKRTMTPSFRMCTRCYRRERLEFYSNRTQAWVGFDTRDNEPS